MIYTRMKLPIGLPFVDLVLRHRLGARPEIDKIRTDGRAPARAALCVF
jgi:hypothetical protein